ncbi:hypothetical protein ACIRBX_32010 [Kitasatospora sp. NPDC096147]|uniref:hypothetical protein n=1 Tax=Kitasatospora sp. NPDC096147 TaxID=3364093 RepID=UPI0037F1AD48
MSEPHLRVELAFSDHDELTAERGMGFLLEELRGIGATELTQPTTGEAPSGTRSGDLVSYTSVLMGLAGGATTLRALIGLAQDWLARRNSGTVELRIGGDELRLTSTSRSDQRTAIEAFVTRERETPDA